MLVIEVGAAPNSKRELVNLLKETVRHQQHKYAQPRKAPDEPDRRIVNLRRDAQQSGQQRSDADSQQEKDASMRDEMERTGEQRAIHMLLPNGL